MNIRIILIMLSSVLMVGVMVRCENEKEDTTIDPCPGWPCFKEGSEWVYSNHDCCEESTSIEIACSTITFNDRFYRLIKVHEVFSNWTNDWEYCVRTTGDTLYKGFMDGDEIACIYGQPIGDSINSSLLLADVNTDRTVVLISQGCNEEYTINNTTYSDGQAYTDSKTYYREDPMNQLFMDVGYSKQFGMIYYSQFEYSSRLVSYTSGKEK